jgi:hypothetical protein
MENVGGCHEPFAGFDHIDDVENETAHSTHVPSFGKDLSPDVGLATGISCPPARLRPEEAPGAWGVYRYLSVIYPIGAAQTRFIEWNESSPKPPLPEVQAENSSRNPEGERSEGLDAVDASERNSCLLESAELMTRRSKVLFWFRLFRDAFLRVKLGQ